MLPPDLATDLASEIRADIDRAKAAILDSLLARLDRLAAVVPLDLPEPDADMDKAHGPEPVDADEYRAMVRPAPVAEPAPEPEPDEFAVVRAAPAAAPEVTPEPPKRPRRRTPPPPAAPLPGPVDEAVEGAPDDDGFGSIPF